MERTQMYLTKKQQDQLKLISKENGVTMSELIRRAIDIYILETPGIIAMLKKLERRKKDGRV